MASNYQQARLDSFELDIESLDDGFQKSLAVFDYPFQDGAALEDMGMNARSVRFRCYWMNERYNSHKEFLQHISTDRICELRHPAYGLINGRVRSVSVRHDDRLQTAEMDVEFVEQLHGDDLAEFAPSVISESEGAFRAGQTGIMDKFKAMLTAAIGAAEAATVATATLQTGQGALSQIAGLSRVARAYVGVVDTAVASLDAMMSTIDNPAQSIISTIDYGNALPGRVAGSVARVVERYSQAVQAVVSAPAEFAANMAAAVVSLRSQVPDFDPLVAGAGALHCTVALASIYDQDETSRRIALAQESVSAFSAGGDRVRTVATPTVATIDELERSLASARECLQNAINLDRDNQSLAVAAQALLRHVNYVKINRERIRVVSVTSPTPLHALCLRYGLPVSAASRVLAMNNDIANPTFAYGQVRIYA